MRRRSFLAASAVLPVAWLFGRHHAEAECAAIIELPRLLTPVRSPLPAATVLVASLDRAVRPAPGLPSGVFPTGAALTRSRDRIPLRLHEIGGKLALLVPERSPSPGLWAVSGLTGSPTIEFDSSPLPAAAVPPRALRIGLHEGAAAGPRSGTLVTATLRLEHRAGPGLVAVAGWWDVAVAGHSASSSATFAPESDPAFSGLIANGDIQIARAGGHCAAWRGAAPSVGRPAAIVWIDMHGRLSSPAPVPVVTE